MSGHSPLGASSAKRWLLCPGSFARWQWFDEPSAEEDASWRVTGTSVHAVIAEALRGESDAWLQVGTVVEGVVVTPEMANRAQVFLNECRVWEDAVEQGDDYEALIEKYLAADPKEFCYGTLDFALVPRKKSKARMAILRDYKDGAGVFVATRENPQLLYYAYLLVANYPWIEAVNAAIVQPQLQDEIEEVCWTREFLVSWAETTLLPSMARAQWDVQLTPGEHCRFCPRRLECPALGGMLAAAAQDHRTPTSLADDILGAEYGLIPAVRIRLKAIEQEVLRRALLGTKFDTAKLVKQKSNRVWKPEAELAAYQKFPQGKFYTTPELLSPAQFEERFGEAGKDFTQAFSVQPDTGFTIAPLADRRRAVDREREAIERYALAPGGDSSPSPSTSAEEGN